MHGSYAVTIANGIMGKEDRGVIKIFRYKKSIIIIIILTLLIMLPPIVYPPIAANAQMQQQQMSNVDRGSLSLIGCDFWGDIGNAIANSLRGLGEWVWNGIVGGIGWALNGVIDVTGTREVLDSCLTGEDDQNKIAGDITAELPASSSDYPAGTSTAAIINNWAWHVVYALLGFVLFAIFIGRILPGTREKTKGKIGNIMVALILTPATLYICRIILELNSALCISILTYFGFDPYHASHTLIDNFIAPAIAYGLITIIVPLIILILLIIWLVMLYFRSMIVQFGVALMPFMPILLCFESTSGFAKKFITTWVEWVFLIFFYDVVIVFAVREMAIGGLNVFNAIGFLAFMCIMPKMYFGSTSAAAGVASKIAQTAAMAAVVAGTAGAGAALGAGKSALGGAARGVRGAKDAVGRARAGAKAGKAVRAGEKTPTIGKYANNERAYKNLVEKARAGDKTAGKELKTAGTAEAKATRSRMWKDDKVNRAVQRDHKAGVTNLKNGSELKAREKQEMDTSRQKSVLQGKVDRQGLTKKELDRKLELEKKPRKKLSVNEERDFNGLRAEQEKYRATKMSGHREQIQDIDQRERSIPRKEQDYQNYMGRYGEHLDNKLDKKLENIGMKEQIKQAKTERKAAIKTYDNEKLPDGLNEEETKRATGMNKDGKGNERTIKMAQTTSKHNLPPATGKGIIKKNRHFLKGLNKEKQGVLKGPEKRLGEQFKEMKKERPSKYQNMKTGVGFYREHRRMVKQAKPKKRGDMMKKMKMAKMFVGWIP